MSNNRKPGGDPVIFVRDDKGAPADAAARFLQDHHVLSDGQTVDARATDDALNRVASRGGDKAVACSDKMQASGSSVYALTPAVHCGPVGARDNGEPSNPIPDCDYVGQKSDEDNGLHPLERRVAVNDRYLQRYFEAQSYFSRLLAPATDQEKLARARYGLSFRLPYAEGDIEIAVTSASIDRDLADLGSSFSHRREVLKVVLKCSASTANNIVKRGQYLLDKAIKRADAPECAERVRCTKQQFASALKLSEAEREIVVQTLIQLTVSGALESVDKQDRKKSIKMLPHSLLEVLDSLRLNDDGTRRWLADRSADEQKQICAEWIAAAVAGTPEQRRAARARCDGAQYSKLVSEFLRKQHKNIKCNETDFVQKPNIQPWPTGGKLELIKRPNGSPVKHWSAAKERA